MLSGSSCVSCCLTISSLFGCASPCASVDVVVDVGKEARAGDGAGAGADAGAGKGAGTGVNILVLPCRCDCSIVI